MNQTGYTKEVMKHFQKPHHYGRLKKYNGLGKVGNVICGDVLWLYINVSKNKKGGEIIKNKDKVAKALGGLPPLKMHCSLLAIDALSEAIYDYLIKHKKPVPEKLKERHRRIERSKKIIEERYKKWTKKGASTKKE